MRTADVSPAARRWPNEVYALGFSARKQRLVRQFLRPANVIFASAGSAVPAGATLALWGSAPMPTGVVANTRALRLEDGFLRSVGLGADLVRPLSWVADGRGIYYDPSSPSDLEALLQAGVPEAERRQRAAALRSAIVAAGLTKYNLSADSWRRPAGVRHVVLVPGQVESDASIACGASGVRNNLALLQAVRNVRPDAYLLYKPHPDVVAGLRNAGAGEADAARWCDEVLPRGDMAALIAAVDEVHVMTSLAGFEALLRGRAVTTYGMPFYAGWGLTEDLGMRPEVAARRTRRLEIDELVAGALIDYPLYLSLATGARGTPELALLELQDWRARSGAALPVWRRALRPALGLAARRRGQ